MFKDREQSFEKKFQHDKEKEFKAIAIRNKLLGKWVASELGLSNEEAEVYCKQVIISDFEKPGDDDVIDKVMKDINLANLNISRDQIKSKLVIFYKQAIHEIK